MVVKGHGMYSTFTSYFILKYADLCTYADDAIMCIKFFRDKYSVPNLLSTYI